MKNLKMLLEEIRGEYKSNYYYSDLVSSIIDDILGKEEDYMHRWMEEIVSHGCISGIVSHLIYTRDIINYYNMFSEDIDEYMDYLIESGCIEEGRIKVIEEYYNGENEETNYFYIDEEGEYIYIEKEEIEDIENDNITFKVWCAYESLMCDILNELEYKNDIEE